MASEQAIYQNLQTIFRDVFDDDSITPHPGMTAADVEGWDSLGHIRLMVAVEERFGIKFSAFEINSWPNVGALVNSIQNKAAA
jgi:acyl carrier protein